MLALALSTTAIAQEVKKATVAAILPLGSQEYSILHEDASDNYYRTSPYPAGTFVHNQLVELHKTEVIRVISPSLHEYLYAQPMSSPGSGNSRLPFSDLPVLDNEILFFRDEAHARTFYDQLRESLELDDNPEIAADDKLDVFEEYYPGFLSYRSLLRKKHDRENGSFTQIEIEAAVAEDFVNDDVQKTFLNHNRMVGIGNTVYYFHQKDVTVKTDRSNFPEIAVLAGLDAEIDLYETSIPNQKGHFEIIAPGINSAMKSEAFIDDNNKVVVQPWLNNVDCDIYTKELLMNIQWGTFDDGTNQWDYDPYHVNHGSVQLTINWDDNTPLQVIDEYTGEWINHTYPTTGDYKPTTIVAFPGGTLEDGEGTNGSPILFKVQYACAGFSSSVYGANIVGNRMLVSKLWKTSNMFGTHVGSFSHSWKQDGNGWILSKAAIYTDVNADMRNDDCEYMVTESGCKAHINDKKIEKVKHTLFSQFDIYNGDIKSHHYLEKDGIKIIIDLVLNPC